MSSLYFKFAAVVVLVSMTYASFTYVENLNETIRTLESNNKDLREAVDKQETVISNIKIDISNIEKFKSEFNKTLYKQNVELKKLSNKFNVKASGVKRSFGKIASAKPKLVENIINKATKDINNCFELLTSNEQPKGEDIEKCTNTIVNISK